MVSMDRGSIENLLSRQKAQEICSIDRRSCWEAIEREPKNFDRLRNYREAIERKSKNLNGSRFCQGSVEVTKRSLDRKDFCWGCVEKLSSLKKMSFSKGKTQGDKCNNQATQPKIQSTC